MADGEIQIGEVLGTELLLHVAHGDLHGPLLTLGPVGTQLKGGVPQAALRLGHQGEGPIAAVDLRFAAPILRGLLLRLLDQLLDLRFAEVGAALNAHALLTARGAIRGRDLQQTIGIDVKGHLHLGDAAGGRRDAGEPKPAEAFVALGHLPLPLQHVHFHRALVGLRGAEHIALSHRNRCVAGDQHLHHTADGLQAQRQRRHVVEHQVAQFAGEDAGLHGGTDGHHLIGIDRLTRLQRNQGAHHLLHHRHAGGTAHQHHVINVFSRQAGIPQGPLNGAQQPIEQIGAEAFKHTALEAGLDVQRPIGPGGDERQRNGGALHTAQFDLGLFGRLREPLQGLTVAAQINAVLLLEAVGEPIDDAAVPVVAAQLGVAAGGLHIEDPLGDAQHRHVKGAAAEVEHQHPLHGAAVKAVGQGRRRGLVEDPLHAEASQPPRIAGGLPLGVVEVSGHGDHGRLHRFTEVGAGVVHELAQDGGHQLLRRVLPFGGGTDHAHVALVVGPHRVRHRQAVVLQFVPLTADEPLEVGEGVAGVEHQLATGQLPHEQLLVLAESHHRWGGSPPLRAGDHLGATTLQHRHHRIGGAQVDAHDPCQLPVRAPWDWVLEPQS